VWTGEHGVRCYSAGMPGGASGEHILQQAALVLDPQKRLQVARGLYRYMFKEEPPAGRSIDQLRGVEGSKVKARYAELAKLNNVQWNGRVYDIKNFDASDTVNKAISCATFALYSISEAVILALGYSPALGFIHSGDARSFVFDVADTVKLDIAIPIAFEQAAKGDQDIEPRVRKACRDYFKENHIGKRLVTVVEDVLCLS
jgi:CRISPR-associated protein Cas1